MTRRKSQRVFKLTDRKGSRRNPVVVNQSFGVEVGEALPHLHVLRERMPPQAKAVVGSFDGSFGVQHRSELFLVDVIVGCFAQSLC